ncbi:MAG: polymer-forming cytoskeletal protein [Thiotrichales bacterium]
MWGKNKSSKARSAHVDTVIGKTTTIKGDLTFSGNLHIEGTVVGNLKADGDSESTLVLDEDGMIQGDVSVPNVIINGTVEGDIFSTNHAELLPKARIKGNFYYNLVEMAIGSEVNGNLVHRKEEQSSVQYLPKIGKADVGAGGKS